VDDPVNIRGRLGKRSARRTMWAVSSLVASGATAITIAAGHYAVAIGVAIAAVIAATALKISLELTVSVASSLADHGRSLDSIVETGRQQLQTNEAALNRVRTVETATGNLQDTNETILNRVRTVETATGNLQDTNETILNRVRTVEGYQTNLTGRVVSMLPRIEELAQGVRALKTATQTNRRHRSALSGAPELRLSPELSQLATALRRCVDE